MNPPVPSVLSLARNPEQQQWAQSQISQGVDPNSISSELSRVNQPNFLEKLLPTGGAILGGLAGDVLGPLGGIAGATGGSALGQQLENYLTGGKQSTLAAGVEGGVGQGIGSAVSAGIGALGGLAGKTGEDVLAAKAAADYAKPFEGVANTATGRAGNLQGALDMAQKLGIENTPEAWMNAANVATGSAEKGPAVISKLFNDITGSAGPAAEANAGGQIDARLQEAGLLNGVGKSTDADVNWLRNQISNMTKATSFDEAGNIKPQVTSELGFAEGGRGASLGEGFSSGTEPANVQLTMDSGQLADTIKSLDNRISQLTPNDPRVTITSADMAKANALRDVKSILEDRLYNSAGVNDAVAKLTLNPEQEAEILKASGGNQALAQDIIDRVNGAENGQALRSVQQDYVNMGKLGRDQQFINQGKIPGQSEVVSAGEPLGIAANTMAAPGVKGKFISLLGSMGKVLAPYAGKAASGAADVATAGGPVSAVNVLSQLVTHAPGFVQQGGVTGGPTMNNLPGAGGMGQPDQTNSLLSDPALRYALVTNPSSVMPLIEAAQKANSAKSALGGIENAYYSAGGGGGMGNVLSELTRFIPGTPAFQYEQQKGALAAQLAKATGGNPQAIAAMLPSLMSDQTGASNQFASLTGQLTPFISSGQLGTTPGEPSAFSGINL